MTASRLLALVVFRRSGAGSALQLRSRRTGSSIWNAAPRADGMSAIVPPWAAINARTMARPRPVPPPAPG